MILQPGPDDLFAVVELPGSDEADHGIHQQRIELPGHRIGAGPGGLLVDPMVGSGPKTPTLAGFEIQHLPARRHPAGAESGFPRFLQNSQINAEGPVGGFRPGDALEHRIHREAGIPRRGVILPGGVAMLRVEENRGMAKLLKNSIHPPDCFMPPLPPDPAAAPPPVGGASPACAAALRKAQPEAVPLAIWDFDGTLFEGDCSEGFSSMDKEEVPGLVQGAGEAGLSPWYPAAGGFDRCWQDYRSIMQRDGVAAACTHIVRIFAGTPEAALRDLAVREFSGRLRPWFFAGALELWRELEAGGVRCVVISASADFFIKGAAGVLGVPANRLPGLRPATAGDGILTPAPVEPLTIGPGKAALLRQVLDHRGTGRQPRRGRARQRFLHGRTDAGSGDLGQTPGWHPGGCPCQHSASRLPRGPSHRDNLCPPTELGTPDPMIVS